MRPSRAPQAVRGLAVTAASCASRNCRSAIRRGRRRSMWRGRRPSRGGTPCTRRVPGSPRGRSLAVAEGCEIVRPSANSDHGHAVAEQQKEKRQPCPPTPIPAFRPDPRRPGRSRQTSTNCRRPRAGRRLRAHSRRRTHNRPSRAHDAIRSGRQPRGAAPRFVVADASAPHAATVLLSCLQTGPSPVRYGFRAGAQLLASNRRPEGSQCGSDRRRQPCLFPTFCGSKAIML
jgi:hypothetical protein